MRMQPLPTRERADHDGRNGQSNGRVVSPRASAGERAHALLPVHGLVREIVLVTFALLVYFGIRNLTAGEPGVADENAHRLLRLEHTLGVSWEEDAQAAVIGRPHLVTLANWVYIWFHWPVILITATVLYLRRPDRYYLLRNAMFLSGAIGFAFFALFPVAPPRLLDLGLHDTVTEHSNAYRALQPPGLTNQYAAFPSLHFGWDLLLAIVVAASTAVLAIRLLAAILPVLMGLAVVVTANHYVIDVAGGLVIVLVAFAVVAWGRRRAAAATLAADGISPGRTHRPSRRVAVPHRPPRG